MWAKSPLLPSGLSPPSFWWLKETVIKEFSTAQHNLNRSTFYHTWVLKK